jgi:3-deoxy-D-manno-octulosonate 8-phosphate phosphatase KdsC-like HAD superfamily phosphatase
MATDITLAPRKQRAIDIANITDDDGDAVTFDGPVIWASSDDAISDVRVQDGDGLSVLVGSFDDIGAAVITGTGDRRKGPEVVPAIITLNVTVSRVLGDVENFDVVVGDETDRVD